MTGHSQARLAGAILKQAFSQIREERIGLVHQVSDKDVFSSVRVKVSGINTHASLSFAVPVDGSPGQKRFVLKGAVLSVNPELVGIAIVSDVNIHPAVAIKIRGNHTQAVAELFVDTSVNRYIFKCPVAFIMKQPVARRAKNFWRAIISRGGSCVADGTPGN